MERAAVGEMCVLENQGDAFLSPTGLRNLFILLLKSMVTFPCFSVKHEEFKTNSFRGPCLDHMSGF